MQETRLPNWEQAFSDVCGSSTHQLEWGLPEPWVQTQLYSWFKRCEEQSGWLPFATELPYLTYYPFTRPKQSGRDWKREGAIKWVDLCLWHKATNTWCWLELKVRHSSTGTRSGLGTRAALDATAKDYVGLCGFDADKTARLWTHPDQATYAHWFNDVLRPRVGELRVGKHYVVSAYLQLGHTFKRAIITEQAVQTRLQSWLEWRSKESSYKRELPDTAIRFVHTLPGNHALLLCASKLVDVFGR